jgi:hypothetical protein
MTTLKIGQYELSRITDHLVMVAIRRRLTEDETWLLDRAAKAAALLAA